jgi:hypothetical protein
MSIDRPLRRCRCGDGVLGTTEGHQEGVALGVDLMPASGLKRSAEDIPVLGEDSRVALIPQVLEQGRGPLDVGKEESDDPGRQASQGGLLVRAPRRR